MAAPGTTTRVFQWIAALRDNVSAPIRTMSRGFEAGMWAMQQAALSLPPATGHITTTFKTLTAAAQNFGQGFWQGLTRRGPAYVGAMTSELDRVVDTMGRVKIEAFAAGSSPKELARDLMLAQEAILATGHTARDLTRHLADMGVRDFMAKVGDMVYEVGPENLSASMRAVLIESAVQAGPDYAMALLGIMNRAMLPAVQQAFDTSMAGLSKKEKQVKIRGLLEAEMPREPIVAGPGAGAPVVAGPGAGAPKELGWLTALKTGLMPLLQTIAPMRLLAEALMPVFTVLKNAIMPLFIPLQDALLTLVNALRPLIYTLIPALHDALLPVVNALRPMVTWLSGVIDWLIRGKGVIPAVATGLLFLATAQWALNTATAASPWWRAAVVGLAFLMFLSKLPLALKLVVGGFIVLVAAQWLLNTAMWANPIWASLGILAAFVAILKYMPPILTLIAAGILIWTAVQWLLNVAMWANPIFAFIGAIGLLITALVGLVAAFGGLLRLINPKLQRLLTPLVPLVQALAAAWENLAGAIRAAGEAMSWLAAPGRTVAAGLRGLFSPVLLPGPPREAGAARGSTPVSSAPGREAGHSLTPVSPAPPPVISFPKGGGAHGEAGPAGPAGKPSILAVPRAAAMPTMAKPTLVAQAMGDAIDPVTRVLSGIGSKIDKYATRITQQDEEEADVSSHLIHLGTFA